MCDAKIVRMLPLSGGETCFDREVHASQEIRLGEPQKPQSEGSGRGIFSLSFIAH